MNRAETQRQGPSCAESSPTCRETLRLGMADKGIEVIVSTAAPIFHTGYEPTAFTCPHGVTYHLEPSREQILQWTRDGVK